MPLIKADSVNLPLLIASARSVVTCIAFETKLKETATDVAATKTPKASSPRADRRNLVVKIVAKVIAKIREHMTNAFTPISPNLFWAEDILEISPKVNLID